MEELTARLSDYGLGDDEVEMLFFKMDTNHDGAIPRETRASPLQTTTLTVTGAEPHTRQTEHPQITTLAR